MHVPFITEQVMDKRNMPSLTAEQIVRLLKPSPIAVAHKGGKIAADTRARIEAQTGRSIVSSEKASDYLPPSDRWESLPDETENEDFC